MRVSSPVRVWHVPKFRDGLDVQGLEGKVIQNVSNFRGLRLSPSKPWKVMLDARGPAGEPVKVVMHLVSWRMPGWEGRVVHGI